MYPSCNHCNHYCSLSLILLVPLPHRLTTINLLMPRNERVHLLNFLGDPGLMGTVAVWERLHLDPRSRLFQYRSARSMLFKGCATLKWLHVCLQIKNIKWKWSHSVVSDSSQPQGLQPTSLLCPWDFPGKSTGVGCHCLLQTLTWPVVKTKLLL